MEVKRRKPVAFATSGSVKLPIYFSPLKKTVSAPAIPGKASRVPEERFYSSYVFYYYENGFRHKRRCAALEEAKSEGTAVAKRLDEEGSQPLDISQADRRIYFQAREILAPHSLQMDAAARLLVEALSKLNGTSLMQAVEFFNDYGRRLRVDATPEQAFEAYMVDLQARGVGEHHKRDIRKFVGGFVQKFPGSLGVETGEIDAWLGSLGGKARNKNNARDKVIAFFNFLERKSYIPAGGATVVKNATVRSDPRPVITTEEEAAETANATDIYTPEQMGKILGVAEQDVRVTIELKGFSGIRTEELARLWWVLIDEAKGHIDITKPIAKVNQRPVPILENLKRRLELFPQELKKDLVSKEWRSSNALYHAWKRVTDAAGVPYKKNGFRNSYISYRLAITKDINLVAYESGNSPEMIKKFYLDLATEEQARAWFAL